MFLYRWIAHGANLLRYGVAVACGGILLWVGAFARGRGAGRREAKIERLDSTARARDAQLKAAADRPGTRDALRERLRREDF